ncbi:MFS transporter [Allokutzneria sp. NRRL B-24872]|uniref:MFS transporter n=1 Tax=Allokutzneria sp. NRRL B-24872 TaxID=1137961 RepID=UPI00143DF6C3|nr:MFS transporter [Allokutzneria sp. NRRL B-24872]
MTAPTSRDRRVPVLLLALLATPTSLSANSATTVIPDLARELHVSTADATWTATAFGWAAVIGAPLTAGLLRSRGPRVTVLVNAALILIGTLLVAVAPTLSVLLAGRAAQAAGGGGLVTLAIGLASTPQRTGAITAGIGLLGAFGPLAGSTLSEISWRVALCLSLPALLAVPAVLRRVPAHHAPGEAGIGDPVGLALVLALASALVLVPRFPLAGLGFGAVLGVLLARHVTRRPDGFVPRSVVRSRAFRVAATVACAYSTAYFALLYTVPRLLQPHWSAERIGVTTLITLAAGSTASLLVTRYASRLGPVLVRAALVVSGGLAVALPLATTWPQAHAAATGFAVFAATAAMAWYAGELGKATPTAHRSTALSLFTLCYQLGGAFGPALATLLIS